jgi:type VI protein secretion system component Hcp
LSRKTTKHRERSRTSPRKKAVRKVLAVELLEERTLLSGTPTTTLQLLPAAGQSTPAAVTLALNSFQLGFHKPAAGTTAASFDALDVTAPYAANSPLVFGRLTAGQTYPHAVLTQRDAGGNTVGLWALNNLLVTDDAVIGSGNGLPAEELKFAFGAVAQSVGIHIAGWSQVTNSPDSSDIPAVPDPEAPAVAPTRMTLDLAGGNATPVSLDLSRFQFGYHNSTTVGPTGVVPGTTSFDELDVTAALSKASPVLFAALTTGHFYDTGTLTQYDAFGNPAAVWVLGTVHVTDDIVTGSGGQTTQEVKYAFDSVTEATGNHSTSWNRLTRSASGPALPTGLALDAVPGPSAATGLTLQLYTSTASDATPVVTLNVNTFQVGFHRPRGATRTTFDALDVTAGLSSNSPALFAAVAGGSPYARVRLTQSDGQGNTTGVFALGQAYVTDDAITGTGSGLPVEELKFAFAALGQGVGPNQQTWNQVTNQPEDFGNIDPEAPAVAPTRITLGLAGGTATPVSLDLSRFQFGFHDPVTVGPTGITSMGTAFDELDVTAALSDAAPDLFAALTNRKGYATATLTQYDAAGNPAAVWVLSPVLLTDDNLTGSGQTTQELKFLFAKVTEVTNPNHASWTLGGGAFGPAGPDPSTLAPLAVYTPTVTVSAGPFTYNGTAHAATATATGVTGDTVSGSFTFTYYSGTSASGTGSATPPTQAGSYTVVAHFRSTDPDYANTDSAPLTFVITPPIAVQSVQVNDGSAQRSMVTSLTVTFNQPITSLDAGAFEIDRGSTKLFPTDVTIAGNQVVVRFTGLSGVVAGSLADGRYTLIEHQGKIHGSGAAALLADHRDAFFRLFGDVNGDAKVDATDLAAFQQAYRSVSGIRQLPMRGLPSYRAYFDVDQNGVIDAVDYFQFQRRYKTKLNPDGTVSALP